MPQLAWIHRATRVHDCRADRTERSDCPRSEMSSAHAWTVRVPFRFPNCPTSKANPGSKSCHPAHRGTNAHAYPGHAATRRLERGEDSALDRLVPLVEAELRQLARRYLRRERPGHVLQTTALVNEAFIRLMKWQDVSWQNRAHFVAMAARLMRHFWWTFTPALEGP